MRPEDVAKAAGVPLVRVQNVPASEVRRALAETVPAAVLDVVCDEPATFWLAAGRYWFDAPDFGDVVAIDALGYDGEIGLYSRQDFPDRN